MKLWKKDNTSTSSLIESFTVGSDRDFDLLLARFDAEGSIAHVTMLGEQGLMKQDDANKAPKDPRKNIAWRFQDFRQYGGCTLSN
jgi:argininosuccinate lyase